MIKYFKVFRETKLKNYIMIKAYDLVPQDLFSIKNGDVIPCDSVLINGTYL